MPVGELAEKTGDTLPAMMVATAAKRSSFRARNGRSKTTRGRWSMTSGPRCGPAQFRRSSGDAIPIPASATALLIACPFPSCDPAGEPPTAAAPGEARRAEPFNPWTAFALGSGDLCRHGPQARRGAASSLTSPDPKAGWISGRGVSPVAMPAPAARGRGRSRCGDWELGRRALAPPSGASRSVQPALSLPSPSLALRARGRGG